MKRLSSQQLSKLVIDSFLAEKERDIARNKQLIHGEFAFVDMVKDAKSQLFPRVQGGQMIDLMEQAFKIKGREFVFKTILADSDQQIVVVEFIESYPDPKTGQVYRTPQVAICEIKDGKIFRTRHYMDPRLSFMEISQAQIEEAYE